MKNIPNFITCMNLGAGFIAIIYTANGGLVTASWLILAAMIFDFLDGFSARLLNAYSDIGKELDSLADIVSFGVAPAFIIYKLINGSMNTLHPDLSGMQDVMASTICFVAVIMPVCAGLRLAVFNLDATQTTSFKGLPTPANAIAVVAVVLAANYSDSSVLVSFTGSPVLIAIYTIILSGLMVTRMPLLSLKIKSLIFKGNEGRYILIGLVVFSFIIFGIAAAPLIIPFYIVASLLQRFFKTSPP